MDIYCHEGNQIHSRYRSVHLGRGRGWGDRETLEHEIIEPIPEACTLE